MTYMTYMSKLHRMHRVSVLQLIVYKALTLMASIIKKFRLTIYILLVNKRRDENSIVVDNWLHTHLASTE